MTWGLTLLSVGVQSCARTGKHLQNLTERVAIDSPGGEVSFYKIKIKSTEIC
jgi:hypothetical protein